MTIRQAAWLLVVFLLLSIGADIEMWADASTGRFDWLVRQSLALIPVITALELYHYKCKNAFGK